MKQRILAVDDELHMLKLLERIIGEKTPYLIQTTNNALEVPPLLEKEYFDIIITDLKMPGMDGIDLLKYVKEKHIDSEVIIITAFGSIESAIEALSRGAFDYITKPFKKEQIIFTVDRAMKFQQLKRENARFTELLAREPFEKAAADFKMEYLHRLKDRYQADPKKMTTASGITEEAITDFLNKFRE